MSELWWESLNNYGHQFHQYQQNEQPPLSHLNSLSTKWPQHVTLEIKVLAWDRHKSLGSPNPPLLITESETAIHIYKQTIKNVDNMFVRKLVNMTVY
jgi:hypothetical protein